MSLKLMSLAWESGYPMGEKFVLVTLCDMASDEGVCFPLVSTLSRKCSMSERAVQGHIKTLEMSGAISRKFRSGTSTIYYVIPRNFRTPAESAPPQNLHPTPAESAPLPPQNLHPTPAESAPRTVSEPSSEPSVNQSSVSDHPFEVFGEAEKASAGSPVDSPAPEVESRVGGLCRRLRLLRVDAAPHLLRHPDWQALLAEHDDEAILGAAELASDRKPGERIGLGYLAPMLRERPRAPPNGGAVGQQGRVERRAAFFDELGMGVGGRDGRDDQAGRVVDGAAQRVG